MGESALARKRKKKEKHDVKEGQNVLTPINIMICFIDFDFV